MPAALSVRGLKKSFRDPQRGTRAVVDLPALDLAEGQSLAVRGESGSGKTTLLHLIAGILPADDGEIRIAGEAMTGRSETARDRLRADRIGYLFQTFNLLPHLSALENVALGQTFRAGDGPPPKKAAADALARVGLGDHLRHRPAELSVGQQQRVAIARALAGRPRLVLADEPTAALDRPRALQCMDLLQEFCREVGAALLVVTHDEEVLARFPVVVTLRAPDGGPEEVA